jgi:hypothetical protein
MVASVRLPVTPAEERVKELKICWIGAVRPSRQLLCSFLRMRSFLNAIKDFVILRRPQGGRLEGRTALASCIFAGMTK